MSKRIKELAEQAFDTAEYPADQQYRIEPNSEFCKKFAELMIVEFSDIVKQTAIRVAQTAYSDGEDAVSVQKRVAGALQVLEVLRQRFH